MNGFRHVDRQAWVALVFDPEKLPRMGSAGLSCPLSRWQYPPARRRQRDRDCYQRPLRGVQCGWHGLDWQGSYRSRSIVVTPIGLGGRVIARLKSSIGVVTGREDQVAITHERQASGNGLPEQWRALGVTTIEGIVIVCVHEAAMHVHTVACLTFHRFRHEAGGNTEAFCHRADTALHTNNLITISSGSSEWATLISYCAGAASFSTPSKGRPCTAKVSFSALSNTSCSSSALNPYRLPPVSLSAGSASRSDSPSAGF